MTRAVGISLLILEVFSTSACEVPAKDDRARGVSEQVERSRIVEDRHLLLIVERGPSGFRVLEAHVVATHLPMTRAPRQLRWRVSVEDVAGGSLFSDWIPESGIRRGTFATADGGTESVEVRRERFSFAVRVPLLRNAARIRFWDTSPDRPNDEQPLGANAPEDTELGAVAYPTDAR